MEGKCIVELYHNVGVEMKAELPWEWCQRMIGTWEAEAKTASEAGDYETWKVADRELENYRQMLRQMKGV